MLVPIATELPPSGRTIDFAAADGGYIFYDHPDLSVFTLEDCIRQTFVMRRYLGVIDVTLAHHSVLTSLLVPILFADANPLDKAYALVHDFHECFVCDVPTRLKLYLPDYRRMEEIWEMETHSRLCLPFNGRPKRIVGTVDRVAFLIETHTLKHPLIEIAEYQHTLTDRELGAFYDAKVISQDLDVYRTYCHNILRDAYSFAGILGTPVAVAEVLDGD